MSLGTDKVQAFPILENTSDNSGVPLHKALQGETIVGKNALAGLVARNVADQFRYLKVNSDDELIVDTESDEVAYLTGTAKVVGGTTEQIVLDIDLVPGREYRQIGWIVSNLRDTEYRILHVDDPTGTPVEVELATLLVGPGDFTDSGELEGLTFTAPATDPVLRLVGTNKDVASALRGTLSVKEVV